MRVGIGYDIHRLVEGRPLILGGVQCEHERGLAGHSDADVLTHAIIDALLGSCTLGDIGHYFPPGDPEYTGADSLNLLTQVVTILSDHGMQPVQVDAVVMCESPKLKSFIGGMRANIARTIGVGMTEVSIKATTCEGLGPVGRSEGIAAQAVVVVEKVSSK